jgi:hypothetical protein
VVGPVTAIPAEVVERLASLKPNTVTGVSSARPTIFEGTAVVDASPNFAGLALPPTTSASLVLPAVIVMLPVGSTVAVPPASVPSAAPSSASVETSGGTALSLVPNVIVSVGLVPTFTVNVWPAVTGAGTWVSRVLGWAGPTPTPNSVSNAPVLPVRLIGVSSSAWVSVRLLPGPGAVAVTPVCETTAGALIFARIAATLSPGATVTLTPLIASVPPADV